MTATRSPLPNAVVSRLAPSPTGLLHLGHARTFLLAWWHARQRGGTVLMRMEDLDTQRSRRDWADGALRDLEWLGLDWDGPVVWQSDRMELYRAAVNELVTEHRAYACVCSRGDVRRAQSAPHDPSEEPRYPGTCRGRFAAPGDAGPNARVGLRFDTMPARGRQVSFVDGIHGPFGQDVEAVVGDFLVGRRDGSPSYQLAVVVDDADQHVNEVFRGGDLLSSTPRQILLQEALGLPHPSWFHAALVADETGRRLAKRHDALGLRMFRERGVDARRVVQWVARSAGMHAPEPTTANEAIAAFQLPRSSPDVVIAHPDVLLRA